MTSTGSVLFNPPGAAASVVMTGDIDLYTVDGITDAQIEAAHEVDRPVVVDLAGVSFMDSSGLALLVRIRNVGDSVRLVNPPQAVTRILAVTGMNGLFDIDSDRSAV